MVATKMRYQAYHQPGEYRPSPVFDTLSECEGWLNQRCVDGHNELLPCAGFLAEWLIEKVV